MMLPAATYTIGIEDCRVRGVCPRWPDKWSYPTADSASRALRLIWSAYVQAGHVEDRLTAYECPYCWRYHLGRLP